MALGVITSTLRFPWHINQFQFLAKNHLESNQFLALALRSFSTSYPNSRPCLRLKGGKNTMKIQGCSTKSRGVNCKQETIGCDFGGGHSILKHIHFLEIVYVNVFKWNLPWNDKLLFIALDVERCPNWNQSTVSFGAWKHHVAVSNLGADDDTIGFSGLTINTPDL